MTTQSARKIGFWVAMAMLFGSIVGIGIFFKNGSITNATGGNGVATLLAWIIGGLVSLFAAISFSEIGSQKFKNVHGIAAWAENAWGKRVGYFTRFNLSFFYYGILMVIFGVFISEAFFQIIKESNSNWHEPGIFVHIIVGLAIDAFFIIMNFFSTYASSWISRFSTALKIIPLLLVAIAGLALVSTNNHPYLDKNHLPIGHNSFTNGLPFSFTGLLAALPAVLFAYDAFLGVGTYAKKVKGGSKTVSKVIIVTLISVLVLYSLISISHILHGVGGVSDLFEQIFPPSSQRALTIFVWIFLFISACGVMNGVSAAGVHATEQLIITNSILGAKKLLKKKTVNRTAWVYQLIISVFWSIIIFIPALCTKSDAIIDGISNFPTLFFFAIYGLTILGYWIKRKKTATDKINNTLWYISSSIALIGITFVVGYQLFYGFTVKAFIDPHNLNAAGFLYNETQLSDIEFFGTFFAALFIFLVLPILNCLLQRKIEKINPIVETESLELGNALI